MYTYIPNLYRGFGNLSICGSDISASSIFKLIFVA